MIADRQAEPMRELEREPTVERVGQPLPPPRRAPRPYLLLAGLLLLLVALAILALRMLTDPNAGAAQAGKDEAQALLTQGFDKRWALAPPTCQSYQTKQEWLAAVRGGGNASVPPDTSFNVVAVTPDGAYRRVDVRVTVPGRAPVDLEVDVKQYGDSGWRVADYGLPGHAIEEHCKF